jgi:hypothetical protein
MNETTDAAASQSNCLQRQDRGPQPPKGATLEVLSPGKASVRAFPPPTSSQS